MDTAADNLRWRQYLPVYLLFVLAFPLGMVWLETHELSGPSPCMFRQTTHLDCPGCGLTRAFRSMGRLDVVSAFYYNPLGPAIFLGTVLYWGYALGMLLSRGRVTLPPWWIRWQPRVLYVAVVLFLLVGIGRIVYELYHPPPPPSRWSAAEIGHLPGGKRVIMADAMIAGMFPGQGSQTVGMGQELATQYAVVADTFSEANDLLGFDLARICSEGPADELKRTSIAQPALVTMSTAYWRLLAARGFTCQVAAGHSLGEYSALVAADALTFADALRLVRQRGQLMEAAAASHPGSMAAVIGASDEDVQALCAETIAGGHGHVVPANYNSPGQVVVSGDTDAIAALRVAAKARGIKALPLAVSGPFHSPLMAEAAAAFADVLQGVSIAVPAMPVIPNVTAQPTTDPRAIREALAQQITGSVQWVRTLYAMRDMGVTQFVEIGPGNVLSGLVQRTLSDAMITPVHDLLA